MLHDGTRTRRRAGLLALIVLAFACWRAPIARADEYVIGPEDVLAISVWLHPELERSVTVTADGTITLAPVGDLKATGLTAKQLSDRIADRLSAYLRQTATVTVTVTQFMSHSVYVQGAVAKPGRYGFERMPSVLDVLGSAGGAITGADLSTVQVVRKEGEQRRTLTADLTAALRTGDTSALPVLQPGDMVVVPGASATAVSGTDGVGVLGEVNKPGLYTVGAGQDLWTVLAVAGGLTAHANLGDVRVLSRGDAGQTVSSVNLKTTLDHGSRTPVIVKPGDVVVVLGRGPNAWSAFATVLGLSRDALNAAVLVDYFRTHKTTN